MKKQFCIYGLAFAALLLTLVHPALASQPHDWQLYFQPAASPVMERIYEFHELLLYIIFAISIFVLLLLLYVAVRFNEKANPTPAKFTHNVLIEVLWTVIPVVILIVIAVPSFKMLYYMDRTENPEMTLKVTGYQWYWGYEYPDHNNIAFTSYMIPDDQIDPSKDQVRLLSTDKPVVLPIDTNIQFIITAADVIHAFALPAFGLKTDAIPGRLNETWTRIDRPGTYYGQCSELCGKDHAFMPIEILAVPKDEFAAWAEASKDDYIPYEEFKNLPRAETQPEATE